MKPKNYKYFMLTIVSVIILLNSLISTAYSYEISSTTLVVNIDGSVEITQILKYITPGENITISLLGDPLYVEVVSGGIPQPVEIQDNKLLIVEPLGEELIIKYIVSNLTNKTGKEWTLTYNSPWETGLILPDEAIVLSLSPETFDVDIINNTVVLLFPPGEINVKYMLIPAAGEQPSETSISHLGGNELITLLIILIILSSMVYLGYRLIYRRRKVHIIKSTLDERDNQIINILASHGELTAKEIMEKTGIPKTPLYRRLKRLVRQGYIEQKAIGGVTYYKIKQGK